MSENKDHLREDIVEAFVRNGYAGQDGEPLDAELAAHLAELVAVEVVAPLLAEAERKLTDAQLDVLERGKEIDRLHSWAGLMELLDEHWPVEVFNGDSEDSGPRIVSLIRAIDKVEASRRDWAAEALRLDQAYEETVKSLSEEIVWQKDVYGDGTDKVAIGRLIGMEDAIRTLTETFAPRPVCAVHPEGDE